jgi:hypothetical protein
VEAATRGLARHGPADGGGMALWLRHLKQSGESSMAMGSEANGLFLLIVDAQG